MVGICESSIPTCATSKRASTRKRKQMTKTQMTKNFSPALTADCSHPPLPLICLTNHHVTNALSVCSLPKHPFPLTSRISVHKVIGAWTVFYCSRYKTSNYFTAGDGQLLRKLTARWQIRSVYTVWNVDVFEYSHYTYDTAENIESDVRCLVKLNQKQKQKQRAYT